MLLRLLARLVLAGCLLFQAAAPMAACQHLSEAGCHHCCHGAEKHAASEPQDDRMPAEGPASVSVCGHCMAHGQSWTPTALFVAPVLVIGVAPWRPEQHRDPLPLFPEPLFKPPIILSFS